MFHIAFGFIVVCKNESKESFNQRLQTDQSKHWSASGIYYSEAAENAYERFSCEAGRFLKTFTCSGFDCKSQEVTANEDWNGFSLFQRAILLLLL